jgi:hypothetical protein
MNFKKQVEWAVMEYFRKLYPEFPAGKLIAGESPDFLIAVNTKTETGIEVTRLVPDPSFHKGNWLENNSTGILFLNKVKEAFEAGRRQFIWVKMLFSRRQELEEARILAGFSMTTAAIRKRLNPLNSPFFTLSVPGKELPSFLEGIWIAGMGDSSGQLWEMAHRPARGYDIISGLQQTILAKEEKLAGYRSVKTREIWLLITVDTLQGMDGNHLINRINNSAFHSTYSRVFVMEMMNARIFRIV